ncbi:MAG: zf-HC2 domain-containing protein [Thermomicrobiales bacterium]
MTANVPRFDTMHHPDIDLLSDFVSGDDSPELRAAITEHLATCEACRGQVCSLRATVALLRGLPQIAPPVSFQLGPEYERHPRSGAGGSAQPSPIVRLLPLVRTLSVAAVLLFLVIGGTAVFENRNHDSGNDAAMVGKGGAEPTSETDSASDALQESGNQSSEPVAPARAAAVPPQAAGGGVVEQGDSASANADQPVPAASGQDAEATPPADSVGQGAPLSSESVDTSDKDGFPWLSTTIGLGALAVILVGLWLVLARISRQR